MKKIISILICFALVLGISVPAFASVPFDPESEINVLFFGGLGSSFEAASNEKLSYTYVLADYLGQEYNREHMNVINLSDSVRGFEGGYFSLGKYPETLKPGIAFLSFNGLETEKDLACAEAIIRALYARNESSAVNFIVLPNNEGKSCEQDILALAKHYGIYVHNIRLDGEILSGYGKFEYSDLFIGNLRPDDKGHDVISRIIINDLKESDCYTRIKPSNERIYGSIIDSLVDEVQSETVQKEYFCSPSGNDENDGTKEKPFLSLAKVVQVVSDEPEFTDITVYLREGTYTAGEGIKLTDAETKNKSVRFEAYNGEEVIISNDVLVDKNLFEKVTDSATLDRVPDVTRGKLLKLDISKCGVSDAGFVRYGLWQYTPSALQFIVDGKLQPISHWPNNSYEKILSPATTSFKFETDRASRWTNAKEAWVYGFLGNFWADDSVRITKIDPAAKTISLANAARYTLAAGQTWSIINLLEEIDYPGEWFLDHETQILYYYPPEGFENADIRLAARSETLVTLQNTKNIAFEGIVFEGSCGYGLDINDCDNTLINNCEIRNIGRNAMNLSGRNNTVRNTYLHDLGRGGIWIPASGDTKTLQPSNNSIEYCIFERVGTYAKTYVPAIALYGIGDRAAHNRISSGLGMAIDFKGNNNIMEYNEIFNYLYEGGDMGVIYTGRLWASGGNTIRYNYIHDCPGAGDIQAIYLDDGMVGVSIYGNVIENITRGIYLHFGSYNEIKNNIILNCDTGIVMRYPLGITAQAAKTANEALRTAFAEGTQNSYNTYAFQTRFNDWKDKYLANSEIYDKQYPYMKNMPYDDLFTPKGNVFEHNVFSCKTDFNLVDAMVEDQTFKDNCIIPQEECDGLNLLEPGKTFSEYIDGFEPLDITSAGIGGKTDVTSSNTLLPLKGQENIQAKNIEFSWTEASGAVTYRLIVARDENFEDLAYIGETNKKSITLDGLKYGGKKYFWKVGSCAKDGGYTEGNVSYFTTAVQENVDRASLKATISKARTLYDTSTEGDGVGQTMIGARDVLKRTTDSAERVVSSNGASQKSIDNADDVLTSEIKKFNASKNYTYTPIDIKQLLVAENNWSGAKHEISGNSFKLLADGAVGYVGKMIETDESLKAKMKMSDLSGSRWLSFGIRAQNPLIQPWNTPCYIFLIKEDVLELQKFQSGENFYLSVENTYIEENKEYDFEFGAVTMGDGETVRVFVTIDGETVFDYVDSDQPVAKQGYFSIYSAGARTELSSVE
ncbi:MAG: right-handed parallel beta-helix repeat-containing protein [Clostridia bacterium]|nr:right-handed parallel beta-helix repeat-containing protein [Clostridia bacterium]